MSDQSYEVMYTPGTHPIKMWTKGVEVEEEARAQLRNIASMPFVHKHIAIMPDVHWGMGATVGSVIPTRGAIIPAAVGVDLGCGMMAVRTDLVASDLPDNLFSVRSAIEAAVPHGRTAGGGPGDRGAWGTPPPDVSWHWGAFLGPKFHELVAKHPALKQSNNKNHLGTLGTGNHFIEVCLDEANRVWVMLHSGSRGVGNRIGLHFINLAKEEMRRWYINLPDSDLAYLPEGSTHFDDYVEALSWAQDFARVNREVMMRRTLAAMGNVLGREVHPYARMTHVQDEHAYDVSTIVNCHHNYVAREHHFGANVWVTRKGAVRARANDYGIIPGSMGARSYIVRGKNNDEAFHSCSHGAGRRMSRAEAKRVFTLDDHKAATAGIECRKDADVIDETPGAYKDIDAVMAAQSELVDIVHTLRQVVCVKG